MPVDGRSHGQVFNRVADAYDRHRPAYPDELVDRACHEAGLEARHHVLEVGCGTGQLTQSLLARELRVTAVEPGERLIERARSRLKGFDIEFVNARLEAASIPDRGFRAAFSASAIHWVDPDVGWRRLAEVLDPGGTLALLSHIGVDDPRTRSDQDAFRMALGRVAPELAIEWPAYRDLDTLRSGAEERRDNVSEVWAWLGGYEIGRGYVTRLFDAARMCVVPMHTEHTADKVMALLGTMSFWARLSAEQRVALSAEVHSLEQRLGRRIRSSTVACLVTARRSAES